MRTVEVKLYQFDELSDKAKEEAREWYRQGESEEFGGFGELYEPAETAAALLGIEFDYRTVELMKGTRQEPAISWSGFSSQGDGASFVGRYAYKKGCSKSVRSEFGTDIALWAIADGLTAIQRKHGYKLSVRVIQSGRYFHKYTMDIELTAPHYLYSSDEFEDVEKALLELMRDFAQWIYDGLQAEYDYRMSDENVDEAIRGNEYDFRENGRRSNG